MNDSWIWRWQSFGNCCGAAFGEYYGNKFFGRNYMTEVFDGTVAEELVGLLYDFMCWGLS